MPNQPFTPEELAIVRRAYARQIAGAAATMDPRVEAAFAAVARETFLGDPPWLVSDLRGGYRPLPCADPVLAYQDTLFALAPDRGVNNGSPSLHARLLVALDARPGEHIVHVGAGTGYYTAILAELVGPAGHVLAIEWDGHLARRAEAALADRANVTVITGDGAAWPRQAADGIYVNFSVPRPAEAWIDKLRPGGRLVLPLGVPRPERPVTGGRHARHGTALRIENAQNGFAATSIGPAYFVCADGQLATTPDELQRLTAAFKRGGIEFVKSLLWKTAPPVERCWYVGDKWALCYDEV
ncbi:rRNA adenine N-6-methyltransferase family protein [Mesorhizobium sp. WSM2239]|uniref:Protein-L-isoaspartate O-methyltransferase n=2 Tax=unclassified Mesorhizobium TaxID=325217 RepID=A0AAU8DHX7_9HYPH